MSGQPLTKTFWRRGAIVAAVVLLATVWFCVLGGDHGCDGHAGPVHVCLAMLESGVVRVPVIALLVIGGAITLSGSRHTTVTLGVPVPPPKLAAFL